MGNFKNDRDENKNYFYDIDDCAKQYMKNISDFSPLDKDEEMKLMRAYKENNDINARNKLITSNLKYTCKLANGYRGNKIPFSNLISEANDALMYAIEKFDKDKDLKVMSYAKWWIMGYLKKMTGKCAELKENELPPEFSPNGLDEEVNFGELYGNEHEYNNNNFLVSQSDSITKERIDLLEKLFSVLDEREQVIVKMRHGLSPYETTYKLEEIGNKLGLTRERVRQILEKAMTKMRSQALMEMN